jgi:drug/metabolite transporter (DMT)-like permease
VTQTIDIEKPKNQAIPPNVYLILIAGILAISSAAILIRSAQNEGVPSLIIAASRLTIAALLLTPIILRRYANYVRGLSRRDLLLAATSGIFLAMHFATWVTSLEYTSVLISVVFVTTGPIWVALIEVLFLKARLNRWIILGLLIAIAGGFIIGFGSFAPASVSETGESDNTRNLIGGGLSLAGAVTVAVYLIIGRRLRATMPVLPYIWLVYGCAGITLIIVTLASGTQMSADITPTALLLLLALAIFPQLIGHSSLNYAVGFFPATIVSMISQLEPIGSAILALLIFQELPLPLQIFGSLVILAGVMLASIGQLSIGKSQ